MKITHPYFHVFINICAIESFSGIQHGKVTTFLL